MNNNAYFNIKIIIIIIIIIVICTWAFDDLFFSG